MMFSALAKLRKWVDSLRASPESIPLDCYTPRAATVLDSAARRAAEEGTATTAADVFIATVDFDKGVAAAVIRHLGIDRDQLKATANAVGGDTSVDALLRLAHEEKRALNHTYLGTEHLFLAGCRIFLAPANPLAADLSLDVRVLRLEVVKALDPNFWEEEPGRSE